MSEEDVSATETQAEAISEPVVFEMPVSISEADIDGLNHVNNIVYVRWVQEVATAHWNAAATDEQQAEYAWVLLRHEIDYLSPAFLTDELIARTHVGKAQGARFERFVEIWRPTDNRLLARTRSVWAAIDLRTGRPRRVTADLRQRFYKPLA